MTELEIKPSRSAKLRAMFVVVAGVVIAGMLVYKLAGGGAGFFDQKANLSTYMPDATGLGPKSQVRIGGLVVGKVSSVEITRYLDPEHAVRVNMRISERYLSAIPVDSQTSIGADTLVGFKFVAIKQGTSTMLAADRSTLASEPLQDADQRANLARTLQEELRDTDAMLATVTSPNTTVGHYIFGDAEYRNLMNGTKAFSAAAREFSDPKGWAGSVIFQSDAYDKARDAMLKTEQSMESVTKGEGAAGKLFADEQAYQDVLTQLKSLRKSLEDLNAGKGSGGALLTTDAGYKKVEELLKATDKLLAPLDAKEGTVAELLHDPKLYQSLNKALHTLDTMLADFHQNPDKYTKRKVKF